MGPPDIIEPDQTIKHDTNKKKILFLRRLEKNIMVFVNHIKLILIVIIILMIIVGLIYNTFAKDQKDISEATFQKLHNLLITNSDLLPRIASLEQSKWDRNRTAVLVKN
ncbi:MAG: hypothetical protein FD188_3144 [Ignavibacteria bacterium]|nr:MAG: hypothetical protein FD188_3144 [Ignavibacteria bacterium]